MAKFYAIKNVTDGGYFKQNEEGGGQRFSSVPNTFFETVDNAWLAVNRLSKFMNRDNFKIVEFTERVVEDDHD